MSFAAFDQEYVNQHLSPADYVAFMKEVLERTRDGSLSRAGKTSFAKFSDFIPSFFVYYSRGGVIRRRKFI